MNIVVVRSRRKTLSLTVTPNGEILVRAPYQLKEDEVYRFLAKHQTWIEKRIKKIQETKLKLADGQNITLFGREYLITAGKTAIKNGSLYLPEQNREGALTALLKRLARKDMALRTAALAQKYCFQYTAVKISSARKRWGSCNTEGSISYSFRIAFLPDELIDYVVIHELCHTQFFNHSKQFWQKVQSVLPDYQKRRKLLKEYGYLMNSL